MQIKIKELKMELKLYKKDKYLRVIKKYKQHQKLLK